jgi:hypothetical protein
VIAAEAIYICVQVCVGKNSDGRDGRAIRGKAEYSSLVCIPQPVLLTPEIADIGDVETR